ncbi:MAG TPA: adenylate/guanylate cyclase domain-containing protein [Anaerolineae bacterium]|nr:adenylate/guanylate cyclase domain-containing protein [Anaerolineae bacterium]
MTDTKPLFDALRNSADAGVVSAIEVLINGGTDRQLCRVNVLSFAAQNGIDEEKAIGAFLHAARLGLFDLTWNVLCPGCGGVLDVNHTLKSVHKEAYDCALCASGYEPTLDEMVEVAFTVNPRVRRIAAHDPHSLHPWEYFRQIFWGSGIDLPEVGFEDLMEEVTIDSIELPPGQKAQMSLQMPAEFLIVFEPVTHVAHFIDVKGEPTRERQNLALIFNKVQAPTVTTEMRPGPLRLALENQTDLRTLPSVWIASDTLHHMLRKRKAFLTAKRLLTNQIFRDIYRTDTLDVDQGLKLTSLTFLFTDLKGSTELYDRVGDLVAYDLVREHFHVLNEIVASEAGAVVKTIGDAVMATFPTPDRALAAALRMRESVRQIKNDLLIKIGIHEGPCLAVTLNDRLDYFGQTVNIAARVQNLADSQAILATKSVVEHPQVSKMLERSKLAPTAQDTVLRGVADKMTIYQIPY